MEFSLTEDQIALRDTVRDLLARRCPPAVVRAAWPGGDGAGIDRIWSSLAEMGVLVAALPDSDGGLGLTEPDLVPLWTELGYAAVPLPVAETAGVAVPLLRAAGDPGRQLAGIASGATRVALALDGDLVPYAGRCDLVLSLRGAQARIGAVDLTHRESTVDASRAVGRVGLAGARLLSADPELIGLARERAALATAAQLVGVGRRMLDLTVEYVRSRRQFGVPVGSFQAVKHQLADALLGLEFAAPALLAAGWSLARRGAAEGRDTRERDVSAAVVLATEAARRAARAAIQCHGAIGYTVEYDLHLYAKRCWALAAHCDLDFHLGRIDESLGALA